MRLLIDAHTLIWAVDEPQKLGSQVDVALRDPANELLLSAGTIWELSIKVGLGKLSLALPFREWVTRVIADLRLEILPITIAHADAQATLPMHHRDPFDRLLAAQAQIDSLIVASHDEGFDRYGITRLWK